MVVDHRQHHVETLRSAISVLIYPIQYLVNLPVAVGQWMGESVSTRENLLEENETALMTEGKRVRFPVKPYQIVTLRLEPA